MADANKNDLEGRTTKTTLEHFYPEIHKLAKKYLSLRGSSVSSERVFSLCGQIVNKKRSKKHWPPCVFEQKHWILVDSWNIDYMAT